MIDDPKLLSILRPIAFGKEQDEKKRNNSSQQALKFKIRSQLNLPGKSRQASHDNKFHLSTDTKSQSGGQMHGIFFNSQGNLTSLFKLPQRNVINTLKDEENE